jgi:hypothetical protein
VYTPPLGAVKPVFSQQMPATASETMQAAFDEMALTASRRLLPSAMNDLREASSPPPMKAPLESAETAFLENASSMRSWEEFFGGMRIRQKDITSLFCLPLFRKMSRQKSLQSQIRRKYKEACVGSQTLSQRAFSVIHETS